MLGDFNDTPDSPAIAPLVGDRNRLGLVSASTLIDQGLGAASRRDVRRKYAWLRNYHNSQLEHEMDTPNLDDIQPELDDATLREVLEPLILP